MENVKKFPVIDLLKIHLLQKKQRFGIRLRRSYFHGTVKKLFTYFVLNMGIVSILCSHENHVVRITYFRYSGVTHGWVEYKTASK